MDLYLPVECCSCAVSRVLTWNRLFKKVQKLSSYKTYWNSELWLLICGGFVTQELHYPNMISLADVSKHGTDLEKKAVPVLVIIRYFADVFLVGHKFHSILLISFIAKRFRESVNIEYFSLNEQTVLLHYFTHFYRLSFLIGNCIWGTHYKI